MLSACEIQSNNSEIVAPPFDQSINIHQAINAENETDYSNMVAETEKAIYSKNDSSIKIKVTDLNIGKGFYLYSTPCIQKYQKNKWVNVEYSNEDISQWLFIAEEGNASKSNFTYLYISLNNIENDLTSGNYRAIVFTKEKTLFSEFSVE